jgi:hypothetical protein
MRARLEKCSGSGGYAIPLVETPYVWWRRHTKAALPVSKPFLARIFRKTPQPRELSRQWPINLSRIAGGGFETQCKGMINA